ncbi:MAG: transposase [Chloroflexi bacterium]|nr:transposase [Chloroflexota bacterium]
MAVPSALSADNLVQLVRRGVEQIQDHRAANVSISLADALMAAFAMFSLKDSSLLEFDDRRSRDANLQHIYGLAKVPCDTQMRTILDPVAPAEIKPLFKQVFARLDRHAGLAEMSYLGHYYLLSLDGTQYFSSKKVHCSSCLARKSRRTGEVTYSHQMLGGAIVHPDSPVVIPLAPEPIIKQDGTTKNDCERNAAKRFLAQVRQDHPDLPLIIVEDALSSNAPHIRELQKHDMRFILGVKEGDHPFLFDQVRTAQEAGQTSTYEYDDGPITQRFHFLNQVPLNESNQDILVNFLEYWEIEGDQVQHWCWITDFILYQWNVGAIMRGGRARWKIENETFNTLKNQGYHFEHNYGHGQENLSVNFALLMMLAFLVDQVQQRADALFQAVLKKEGGRKRLWAHARALFYTLEFASMTDIYRALLYGYRIEQVTILGPT